MKNFLDELLKKNTYDGFFDQMIDYIKLEKDFGILSEKDSKGESLISVAVEQQREKFLNFVLANAPEYAKIQDISGRTFLHYAADKGLLGVCYSALELDPSLAKIQDIFQETFLHRAACSTKLEPLLKAAIATDPTLMEIRNRDGKTVADLAFENGLIFATKCYQEHLSKIEVTKLLEQRKKTSKQTKFHIKKRG